MMFTASACVIATAVCLLAVIDGYKSHTAFLAGSQVNLWILAALASALAVLFSALSYMRTLYVRVDTRGMTSRASGPLCRHLRGGHMLWKDIRSLRERDDRLLEVRAADGAVFEIPMRVANYAILRPQLENMVRLYGDRPTG